MLGGVWHFKRLSGRFRRRTSLTPTGSHRRYGRLAGGVAGRYVPGRLVARDSAELRDQIDPRGVRLTGAVVAGPLDLAGLEVPFPLQFDDCEFEAPPVVEGAQLHELAFTGCGRLPGLLGNEVRIRRDLDLSRSRVAGAHQTSASTSQGAAGWLCESDIGGRLLCAATSIDADDQRSIQADRMRVAGTVRFPDHFTAYGEVRLPGARIGGSVDFSGAHVSSGTAPRWAWAMPSSAEASSWSRISRGGGRSSVGASIWPYRTGGINCHGHADAVSGEMSQNPAS